MEVVVFAGIPGSGKTTLYRARFADTHVHVSKDNFPNAASRDARQDALIGEALSAGRSVVVDNTNPRVADRQRITAIARAKGARSVAYVFDIPTRTAIARNEARTGRAKVPKVAIFTVAKRFEPVSYSEDFDEIYKVSVDQTGLERIELVPRTPEQRPVP